MTDSSFKSVEIRYQTAQVVPPPYAHFYTLSLRSEPTKKLSIEVTITYTDRHELEEEEILGEGFTINDDYQWSGHLPTIWQQPISELIRKTQFKPVDEENLTDNQEFFLVTIENEISGKRAGAPSNRTEWQFVSQELIQAAYEVSEKEKPFEATYVEIDAGKRAEAQLTASFSRREARLELRRNNQNRSVTLPWKEVKSMMEVFYGVDYNPEDALTTIPRKPGHYLNLGTSEWFETGTALIGEEGAIRQLRTLLTRLIQS